MEKKLILMRGLPGSGKSTKAKELSEGGVVYSTDDFFMVGDQYKFDPNKLGKYHNDNLARTEAAMQQGITPVVVDNTNVAAYEMKRYVLLADKYGYKVEFARPETDWAWDAEELAKRNTHGVPQEKIEQMLGRFDENEDLDYIKSTKAPWER